MVGYAGEVKLIDFGTARGHNRRCHTVAGVVFAKPGYVAPEVARQQVGDGRIDLYALGIMLWELCAGRRFLTGDPQKHLDDAAAGRSSSRASPSCAARRRSSTRSSHKLTAERPRRALRARARRRRPTSRASSRRRPAAEDGERERPRADRALMRTLWPHEPARSRARVRAGCSKEARGALARGRDPSATPDGRAA